MQGNGYSMIIHENEKKDGYWGEFVDFNVFATGKDMEGLVRDAEEALEGYLEYLREEGSPLPVPIDIQMIPVHEGEKVVIIGNGKAGTGNAI